MNVALPILATLLGWRFWGLDGACIAAGGCVALALLGAWGSDKWLMQRLSGYDDKANMLLAEVRALRDDMKAQRAKPFNY